MPTAQANNEQATATTITAGILTTVISRRNDANRLSGTKRPNLQISS